MQSTTISFLTCGGTIDKSNFHNNFDQQVGRPQLRPILDEGNATIDYTIQPILMKDSLNMTQEDLEHIRCAIESLKNDKVIITHGTDRMIETAQYLSNLLHRTIVLTGAMTPAQFKNSDSVFNIGSAVLAVQTLPSGVYIVMNGQIFDPFKSKKNTRLNIFERIEL